MKRFFTICIAALLAAASFSQVNVWRSGGYLKQVEKATLDSITFSMADPYTVYERSWEGYPTGETRDMFDLQNTLYVGLEDYGYTRQNDFGFAAVCLFLETRGQDYVGQNDGYNWFGIWGDPAKWRENDKTTTIGLADYIIWYTLYKPILAANHVIATRTSGNEEDNYAVAQAKALRAFEYMQLAQAYQVAYNESTLNLPCVPLVLDTMPAYLILTETPATVAQIYAQIKSDLDDACANLEGYMRPSKHVINQAVAYGLRARYNLLVHKYNQAATDAEQALLLSGATPLSIEESNKPGFADASAHNVLWANIINEEDDVVQNGVSNWPAHLSLFYNAGYTSTGRIHPAIASELYGQIPASDVRKGWWLNEDLESPLLDAEGYSELKSFIQGNSNHVFANVKFGTEDAATSYPKGAAGDWIVMRAEEMILLRAEALARAGKDGASVLTNFVKTYRDPDYHITAHGLSVADEIWWQRRVELWGEGFAFNDLMRLHKGVTRTTSANWPDAWRVDVPADDERFPLAIPAKDPDYKVLAVWQNGEKDLYNTYYIRAAYADSITLGEAKEIDDVYVGYGLVNNEYQASNSFTRTFEEGKMGEVSDTVFIDFTRNHNLINPITVPLIIEADPVFVGTAFPKSISFEGGSSYKHGVSYTETSFVVNVNELPLGTYQFTITIPDEYHQGTLAPVTQSFTYQIVVREHDPWDDVEIQQGVWVDDAGLCSTFGLPAGIAWIVNYKSLEQPDGTRQIRILNPFKTIATAEDPETGLPNGFPYADYFDIDESKGYNFMIEIQADGTTALFADDALLGLSYSGYGDMIIVNYAASAAGVYDAEAGRVTFDAASKGYAFGFDNAGQRKMYSYAGFRFYESKEAWLADQEEPVDVDADVTTYEGNWTIKGLDVTKDEDVPVSANVTVTSYIDPKEGQYYAIEGLYPNMPVCYGTFDEETHKFKIEANEGDPVEIEGVTYIPVLYMVDANWGLSTNITLDIVPGEGGTLVTDKESAAMGFIIVYFNAADQSQYVFGEGMFNISFEPANAGAPVRKAAGIPAKIAKRNGKQSIPAREMILKRPAKKLVKKNIRLLNSNKEFQKNEVDAASAPAKELVKKNIRLLNSNKEFQKNE